MAVIVDTSCLIILSKIGKIDCLKRLFGEILISSSVLNEFGETIPDFIVVYQEPININILKPSQTSLDIINFLIDRYIDQYRYQFLLRFLLTMAGLLFFRDDGIELLFVHPDACKRHDFLFDVLFQSPVGRAFFPFVYY